MKTEHFIINSAGPLLTFTLKSPYSLNVLQPDILTSLTFAIHKVQTNPDVKGFVLADTGKDFKASDWTNTNELSKYYRILNECILTMKQSEKPIITSVQGLTVGAGVCLIFASDMIVAAEDSQFAFKLENGGKHTSFFARLLGPYLANQFLNNNAPLSALHLHQMGAVNYITPLDKLQEETVIHALKMTSSPENAFSMIKKLIDHSLTDTLTRILEREHREKRYLKENYEAGDYYF